MSSLEAEQRVLLVSTLLDKAKAGLLSKLAGSIVPKFFDYNDDDLADVIEAIDDKEEFEAADFLKLAACYYIMYLKATLEETHGG